MPDKEELQQAVVALLVEGCPLNKVRKEDKPCPYFGVDKTCNTCSYHWHILVKRMLEAVGAKRLGCQKAKERVKELEEEVDILKVENATILSEMDDPLAIVAKKGLSFARGALSRASVFLDSMEDIYGSENADQEGEEGG
jgi:hypothetical protein